MLASFPASGSAASYWLRADIEGLESILPAAVMISCIDGLAFCVQVDPWKRRQSCRWG